MMIKIENLYFQHSDRFSLVIDKFDIPKGALLSIIGPNGAGKSTLLNILALLDKPERGIIEIFGEDIATLRDVIQFRRRMSFVFSRPYLLERTVYDNVNLPLKIRGIRNDIFVRDTLDLFEISHLEKQVAESLSHGEMYRVSLARAFVTNPELIFLDEPFTSLDRPYKESLMLQLRRIIKSRGVSAVFVTQDFSESLIFADTIAVMNNGRMRQYGSPEDVFTRPASEEVAKFVGIETVLKGRITDKTENLCYVRVMDKTIQVVSEYSPGNDVFVCIRPEDVTITENIDVTSARNCLEARIKGMESWKLGHKVTLNCGFDVHAVVTGQSVEELSLYTGKKVAISFKATAPHLILR